MPGLKLMEFPRSMCCRLFLHQLWMKHPSFSVESILTQLLMNSSILHQAPCTLPAYITSGLKGNRNEKGKFILPLKWHATLGGIPRISASFWITHRSSYVPTLLGRHDTGRDKHFHFWDSNWDHIEEIAKQETVGLRESVTEIPGVPLT